MKINCASESHGESRCTASPRTVPTKMKSRCALLLFALSLSSAVTTVSGLLAPLPSALHRPHLATPSASAVATLADPKTVLLATSSSNEHEDDSEHDESLTSSSSRRDILAAFAAFGAASIFGGFASQAEAAGVFVEREEFEERLNKLENTTSKLENTTSKLETTTSKIETTVSDGFARLGKQKDQDTILWFSTSQVSAFAALFVTPTISGVMIGSMSNQTFSMEQQRIADRKQEKDEKNLDRVLIGISAVALFIFASK